LNKLYLMLFHNSITAHHSYETGDTIKTTDYKKQSSRRLAPANRSRVSIRVTNFFLARAGNVVDAEK